MNNLGNFTKALRALILAMSLPFFGASAALANTELRPFSDASLAAWEQRSFVGNTQYQLIMENGVRVLQGSANAQASLLYKPFDISLLNTPQLSWHWKIKNVLDGSDEQSRAGDDFPARVYVAYQYGGFPWQIYTINYVWASNTPKGNSWASPYTKKSRMIAIQSGDGLAGQWQFETRDVADDFKQQFGVDVDSLKGIAVMVDTDNTGKSAVAHFGAIGFSKRP